MMATRHLRDFVVVAVASKARPIQGPEGREASVRR